MKTTNTPSPVELLQPKLPPRLRLRRCALIQPEGGRIPFEFCEEEASPLVLRELIESPAFRDEGKRIPLALGWQEGKPFIIPDLAALPHLLLAGHYATEITAARRVLLLSLLLRQGAGAPTVTFINGSAPNSDRAEGVRLLKEAAAEALARVRYFDWAGVGGVEDYNCRSLETMRIPRAAALLPERLERRVILLHDPGELIRCAPRESMDALILLCKATSRSCFAPRDAGIHLIITCDNPTCANLPGELLRFLPARAVFHSRSRKRLLPGWPADRRRLRDGEFRYRAHEEAECLIATLPICTEAEFRAVMKTSFCSFSAAP